MSILQLCVCFILGYIFGNIPNGYLYAKSQGVDIYHQGSGNPGSTNVLRTLGKRAGITVLLMDIAKCMVPIFLMILFLKPENEDQKTLILMLTGIGAILGHNFPILPGVKGGKGVACTLGLLCFFILIVLTTKYVSLGSVLSVFVFFLSVLLMGKSGILFPFSEAIYLPMCGLSLFLALLCLFQHRENMKRLMNGTENKFGKNK